MTDIRDHYGPGSYYVHKYEWLAWKYPLVWRDIQKLTRLMRGQDPTYPFKPLHPGPFGETGVDYGNWLIDYGGGIVSDVEGKKWE